MLIRCAGSTELSRLTRILQLVDPTLEVVWVGEKRSPEAVLGELIYLLGREPSPHQTLVEVRDLDGFVRRDRSFSLPGLVRWLARRDVAAGLLDEMHRDLAGAPMAERAARWDRWRAELTVADAVEWRRASVSDVDLLAAQVARAGSITLIVTAAGVDDPRRDQLVAAARAAGVPCIDLREVPRGADPLDALAASAGHLARAIGIDPGDSPLARPLREGERRIRAGRVTVLAEAEAWLHALVPPDVDPAFRASFVERLAPAMLRLSAATARLLVDNAHRSAWRVEEMRRFLTLVEQRCSDDHYAALQDTLLSYRALHVLARPPSGARDLIDPEKYVDVSGYAISKFAPATQHLGLRDRAPSAILDLGAGAANFGLVCEFFGHDYTGLDIPCAPTTPFGEADLYGEMFECFGLRRILQRITPFVPLEVPRRYDLVTCFMATFCARWGWPEWRFFLRDLVEQVVARRFEIYLHVGRQYLDAAVLDGLQRLGATLDLERSTIRFTEAQAASVARA